MTAPPLPPPSPQDRRLWTMLKRTWKEYNADNGARIGAALAYYTVFSIAPILVIAVAVVGAIFGEAAAQGELSNQLQGLLGPEAAQVVESLVRRTDRAEGGTLAAIVSFAALVLGATSVFVVLQNALNEMWAVPPRPHKGIVELLRKRLMSFAMVLVVGFLLLVSLVLSAVLAALSGWARTWATVPPVVLALTDQATTLIVVSTLFALLFKMLPDARINWGDVWVGALVTALAFMVGRFLIGQYLGNSGIASTYGAAGSFVVLLVWVYYSAQIVLLGAEFTQVWARARGSLRFRGEDRPPS